MALHDLGRTDEALRTLDAVLARHPHDRDTLAALAAFYREAGVEQVAREYADRLEALEEH